MISGNFISVKSIADKLMMNPILKDLNFEFIIDKTIECLRLVNMPPIYVPGTATIQITNFRGDLPIDMIYLKQAFFISNSTGASGFKGTTPADLLTGQSLSMQDNTSPLNTDLIPMQYATDNVHESYMCLPHSNSNNNALTFSLTNNKIYTNIEQGGVFLTYKAIAVDENCYPLIPDNIKLIRAIESYIKYKWFDILNDMDKVTDRKLSKAEADYCWNIGQAQSDLIMPNETEMEALVNSIAKLLPNTDQFNQRMKFLGSKEFIKTHP